MLQRPWMLYLVTWPSHDNHATMQPTGHLVGHPPCRHTWALGVPTFFLCYSCCRCIIDIPFQAPGPVDPCLLSFPSWGSFICSPVSGPWLHPPSPSCRQPP